MAVIWAVNYSVAKFGTLTVAPMAYNATRVALAAVVFVIIARFRAEEWPSRRDMLVLFGLGALGNGLYQVFFIEGLARSRAGTVALMLAASPAFVAIVGRALGVERVNRRGWFGIALQLAGVACVVLGNSARAHGDDSLLGSALIVAGSLCWAFFAVLVKPYTQRVSAVQVGAATVAGGAAFVVAAGVPSLLATQWSAISGDVWWAIIYSGLIALVVGNLIWYRGVRILGPTRVSMYSNLQPMIALLVAWAALGEVPTVWQGLGAGSIMTGLLVTRS